ncbi:hypothetical protein B2A_06939 [mine drainage metagenome]|uniref:Uncharacterized protein n=1 Tax=mine drainage metagenome TaxID=410659 RepID=T1BDZ0_9ZZZZ
MIPGGPGVAAIYPPTGSGMLMNATGGFTNRLAFYCTAPQAAASADVYFGLNWTGTLLASLNPSQTALGENVSGCDQENYCPYREAGVDFSGSAESVIFGGATDRVGHAELMLGSMSGATVPELPSLALFEAGSLIRVIDSIAEHWHYHRRDAAASVPAIQ